MCYLSLTGIDYPFLSWGQEEEHTAEDPSHT